MSWFGANIIRTTATNTAHPGLRAAALTHCRTKKNTHSSVQRSAVFQERKQWGWCRSQTSNADAEPCVELLHRVCLTKWRQTLPTLVRVVLVTEPKPPVKGELNQHPSCERRHPVTWQLAAGASLPLVYVSLGDTLHGVVWLMMWPGRISVRTIYTYPCI